MLRSERSRVALSVGAVAMFGAMLVGTSKPEDSDAKSDDATPSAEPAPSEGKADAKADAPPPPEIPSTADWQSLTLSDAKLTVRLPKGATVDPPQGGLDANFAGRYFRVVFEGGAEAYFANSTGSPVDLVDHKRWYENDANGFEGFVLDAADAQVARRKEGAPVGEYCETTACATVDGKPLCVSSAGATVDGDTVTKLTEAQCLEVVAITRSLEAVP